MSTRFTRPRFVRHQDASAWDLRDRLKVNPRSGAVETRAGMTWTGVRKYQTPNGELRVLRRRSQVESPGHLRTLRRLPLPEGHPSGDRDVCPSNSDELVKGWSGDQIDIETMADGFARPVASLTVFKPDTFCKMMTPELWAAYARDYPEYAKGVTRPSGPARTGTSLGYNALWLGPMVEAEIIGDRDGALVGSWLGPDGVKYEYDVEHVIDPDCEIVKRLVRDDGFDPLSLGGQHCAIALEAFAGRGAAQSELMRVVDSKLIGADPSRGRVQFQVPRATRVNDMKWTVGASRELPLEDGDRPWDGDAAAASIFESAGWPDSPDPEKAKRGFLIYDADAPDMKGSYKLPFARVGEDGMLRVPASGLRAVASYLPQTDAPSDVLDRAQSVVDFYKAKREAVMPARDSRQGYQMPKQTLVIGVRDRGVLDLLTRKGLALAETHLTLDEVDASKLQPIIDEIMQRFAQLAEMLKMAETENMDMTAKMVDMPTVEEAQAKVEEMAAMLAKAQEELASVKTAAAEQTKTADAKFAAQTADLAALEHELGPVRAQQLADFRTQAVAYGLAKDVADACTDAPSLKRAFVAHTNGESFAAATVDDATIGFVFDGAWAALAKAKPTTDAKKPDAAPATYVPGAGLAVVPNPKARDNDDDTKNTPTPVTAAQTIGANL